MEKRNDLLNTLLSHHITHSGDKPFKRDQCNKGFIQRSLLISHHRHTVGISLSNLDVISVMKVLTKNLSV